MEISKHIVFSTRDDCELFNYLIQHGVPVHQVSGHHVATIDVFTSNPHWPWISNYVQKHNKLCLSDMIFTKQELLDAQWMYARSIWRFGYPEPSSDFSYQNITYSQRDYCENCGSGLVQKAPFRIKKAPNWNRRHFFSLFWIEDELFISDTAKDALMNAGITGISFQKVHKKNGKDTLDGVNQLMIDSILNEGLIENGTYIKHTTLCPSCNRKKLVFNCCEKLAFNKDIFLGANDIVKTHELFGDLPKLSARMILINQRTYRALVDQNLDRTLSFYPIELV